MKILVVDDVGYTRHFHARLLQKFGHDVLSAEDGTHALRILERDLSIDVVLTDLMMREMDGVELYKASLRISRMVDGGQAPSPAFILMTALRPGGTSQQKDIEKLRMAKEIGFLDVLYKPIDAEHLKQTLDNLKFARGQQTVDIVGASRRVQETVSQLIAQNDWESSNTFIETLRSELDRLEAASTEMTDKAR
jgi:CheY-like chemotaxis protein